MTSEDREKAIRAVQAIPLPFTVEFGNGREQDLVACLHLGGAGVVVDAILAALSPAEPVQELPVLDPDEQARHEQAMRELAALAFDPNSLDRTEPCPGWWGGHESPAEPKPVESLTAEECKALRVALIFGDPKNATPSDPDPRLESAKAKLKAIEAAALSEARLPRPEPGE